jgi:putative intracellular protease/amidase
MDIAIVLYDGFDELDAIGPFEVFANAARAGADLTVTLRTVDGSDRVTANHGLDVGTEGALADVDPDLLVVPGGGWNDRSPAGARAEAEAGTIPETIAELYDGGTAIAGVCTGGMLLARSGILDGRPAVTHGGAMDDLRETAAEVVQPGGDAAGGQHVAVVDDAGRDHFGGRHLRAGPGLPSRRTGVRRGDHRAGPAGDGVRTAGRRLRSVIVRPSEWTIR